MNYYLGTSFGNRKQKKKKEKTENYLLSMICYTEMFPSSSMQKFMAVWSVVSS